MTEKDFIFAWLLASRSGSDAPSWTLSREHALIEQAKRVYQLIQQETKNATNG